MIIDLEAQLLRDAQPLSRPTRWSYGAKSFDPTDPTDLYPGVASWKLFLGPAAQDTDQLTIAVGHLGWVDPRWLAVSVQFSINGIPYPSGARPGQVYVDDSAMGWGYGMWSCAINYPVISNQPAFAGLHTVLLRTIVTEGGQ